MRDFKTILVSLDFSESATSALNVAVKLAGALGAELHLLHVFRYPMQIAVAAPVPQTSEVERGVRQRGQSQLDAAAELARNAGLTVTTHLLEGEVAPTIVEVAKDLAIDMIVLGRRGMSRLQQIMLGSVADHTLRLAPCPVLIVRAADGAD